MKTRRLAIAAAATLLFAAGVWWFESERPRRLAAEAEERSRLAHDENAVTQLVIEHPESSALRRKAERYSMERQDDGSWSLLTTTTPAKLRADVRAVKPLLQALATSRVQAEVAKSLEGITDRAQFGLDPPAVTVRWKEGGAAERSLALGSSSPGTKSGYGLLDDGRLVLVPIGLLHQADWDSGWFREKSVLGDVGHDFRCLEIRRVRDFEDRAAPLVRFEKDSAPGGDPDLWRMSEPVNALADRTRFGAIVSKLTNLLAQGFGAEIPTEADLRDAGFLPPAAVLTLTTDDGRQAVLEIGDESYDPDSAWARVPGGPLVLVRVDLRWDALLHEIRYRDPRPFTLMSADVTSVRWNKGVVDKIVFGMQLDDKGIWQRTEPQPGIIPEDQAQGLVTALFGPSCGRFEDELAANPALANGVYSWTAAGSARFHVEARVEGGLAASIDVAISAPFLYEKDVYSAVRTTDSAGRVSICIVHPKDYDLASGLVRGLATAKLEQQ